MARRSKLDWMKDLRGADLSAAEFRVLVILMTYSDKSLLNAHPGKDRLVKDTGMARSTVMAALKSLQQRGWIRLTQEGGNQYGKGLANTYSIHTPVIHKGTDSRTLKGRGGRPLATVEGADSQTKGPISDPQGADSRAPKGLVDRPPSGNTSGSPSGPFHHSDRNLSAPTAPASTPDADTWWYDADNNLTDDSYERLIDILGGCDTSEYTTLDGMLSNGEHPQAIINTINARRAG